MLMRSGYSSIILAISKVPRPASSSGFNGVLNELLRDVISEGEAHVLPQLLPQLLPQRLHHVIMPQL